MGKTTPVTDDIAVASAVKQIAKPVYLIDYGGQTAACHDGTALLGMNPDQADADSKTYPLLAYAPALLPDQLGSPIFKEAHGLRYAYIIGAMANGITSVEMVKAAGSSGMVGFFGAAGLALNQIEGAIWQLKEELVDRPFGFNLIHSPTDPHLESATVDLYLKHDIHLVSASAFLDITLPLVRYRINGIHRDGDGNVVCPNKIIAKVSRFEVARKFLSPSPEKYLKQLLDQGHISSQQAELAEMVPLADDLTAEADSGGHTDNQPAISLLPTMLALRDQLAEKHRYPRPVCVGLAGGIATPDSAAAAFALGADYILTGSINQACTEAGTSKAVRRMLAEAQQADVTMAPAADMFEMGVKVQVLKRGTMFPFKAAKLYDLYNRYNAVEEISPHERALLEKDYFRCSLEQVWQDTRAYFAQRNPQQIARAETNPKYKLALIFRSYLGQSSNWANSGDPNRQIDYQIWCGPAIGAFNAWVQGTFLENPRNRQCVTVGLNLLYGAAVATRLNCLRTQGIRLGAAIRHIPPLSHADILGILGSHK